MDRLLFPLVFVFLSGVSAACGALTLEIIIALRHWPRINGQRTWRGLVEHVKHEFR